MRANQFLFVLATSIATGLAAHAAESPRITRSVPTAAAPGQTVEITFTGERLDSMTSLWTSFPSNGEKIKSSRNEAVFQLTVASNVPVQVGAIRLVGTNLLSDLFLLTVDDLPTVRKTGAKKEKPQALEAGTATEGTVEELATDYFTFSAKKGEQFSLDLLARRLGSTLDPLLRILDKSGKELVYSLQFNEPNGDPRIRFTAPEAGTYSLELRDVSYHGGGNYFYRLRCGKFPLITTPFPPELERGARPAVKFVGPAVDGLPTPKQLVAWNAFEDFVPLSARLKGVAGSGFSVLRLSDLGQVQETEPNEKPAQATRISLPTGINGRFEKARDRDYYQFTAEKGQRVTFDAKTRSLGSACDVSLRLVDSANAQLAESANTTASEGSVSAKIEKPGNYFLIVEELTGASGPDFVYHIDAKLRSAPFSLAIENDKGEKSTNGAIAIHVSCARDHYDGPISLSVKGLDGCRLENSVIEKKKTNATVRVFLPESISAGEVALLSVQGKATIGDSTYTTSASTMPAIRKAFPMLVYPPERFDGFVWMIPFEK